MLTYDKPALLEQLTALPWQARTAFSAACAELLIPAVQSSPGPLGAEGLLTLRASVDEAWSSARRSDDARSDTSSELESLLSGDEGEEGGEVCENAVAAVIYALRSVGGGDAQDAEWAARQPHDAADWWAQQQVADLDLNDAGAELVLASHPAVQSALEGIWANLRAVSEPEPSSWETLQRESQARGAELARLLRAEGAPTSRAAQPVAGSEHTPEPELVELHLIELRSAPAGRCAAVFLDGNGERVETVFTPVARGGRILGAAPDPDVFTTFAGSIEELRAVVAAVVAFCQAAGARTVG